MTFHTTQARNCDRVSTSEQVAAAMMMALHPAGCVRVAQLSHSDSKGRTHLVSPPQPGLQAPVSPAAAACSHLLLTAPGQRCDLLLPRPAWTAQRQEPAATQAGPCIVLRVALLQNSAVFSASCLRSSISRTVDSGRSCSPAAHSTPPCQPTKERHAQ